MTRGPALAPSQGAHLQHVREVPGDALQQGAVGPPPRGLPRCHVVVALADQSPHLLQDGARVDVITERLVDRGLLVVKAEREAEEEGGGRQTDDLPGAARSERGSARVGGTAPPASPLAGVLRGPPVGPREKAPPHLLFSSVSLSSHFSN